MWQVIVMDQTQRRLNYNDSCDRQQRDHGSHDLPSLGSRRKIGGIMGKATSGGLLSTLM